MSAKRLLNQIRAHLDHIPRTGLSITERIELSKTIAALLLSASNAYQTRSERRVQKRVADLLRHAKAFSCAVCDSSFRTKDPGRLIDHLLYIAEKTGFYVPGCVSRAILRIAKKPFATFLKWIVSWQMRPVILPGEHRELDQRLQKLHSQAIKINLNRLGEAILGNNEADNRLQDIIEDLKKPLVSCVSVKISSIYCHVSPLSFDECLSELKKRFRIILQTSMTHNKMVYLDMEEYKDLALTVQLFQEVLSEPEFHDASCGIALQSYLPDSFLYQQQLTKWAIEQRKKPIQIRIVKGANLGMERVEASLRNWPQAPFHTKNETDQNFKKMIDFGLIPEHAKHVYIGVASHNLFDIAYALVLSQERLVAPSVSFELLSGMAPHIARTLQNLTHNVLLYCPAAKKDEFHTAMAYLMRRLDEQSAPENFLTHLFDSSPNSKAWQTEQNRFTTACLTYDTLSCSPQRTQNRFHDDTQSNWPVADTDWSLAENRTWAREIIREYEFLFHEIPLVIDGNEFVNETDEKGIDPSCPTKIIHSVSLATLKQAELALQSAKKESKAWAETTLHMRASLFRRIALELQKGRKSLIGSMMLEGAKPMQEADSEVSEAVDFALYYAQELESQKLESVTSRPGIALVASPWNFPVSIPTSAILAALASGRCVIFKPAPEARLSGWHLAQCLWRAGIDKKWLQFLSCSDDPVGSFLIQDERIDTVLLTGSTETARRFLQMRPQLSLFAETGGKNSIIVSALADRDLAVRDIIKSSFGYAGQKCSACSLLILEEEVYHDTSFRRQLFDAASSLITGSVWNVDTELGPLIRPPSPHLLQALTELEEGESWLVKPRTHDENPHLWTCGITYGVQPHSKKHSTEFFGPVLSVLCAKSVDEATIIANSTPYGLTAGLHSLDEREQMRWLGSIQAGNCYINRTITGAIVGRQPFGGCKASSFGIGMKAGGPNYLLQLADHTKVQDTKKMDGDHALLEILTDPQERREYVQALHSYTAWNDDYFSKSHALSHLVGQDNILSFVPKDSVFVLFQDSDSMLDCLLVLSCCLISGCGARFGMQPKKLHTLKHLVDAVDFDTAIQAITNTPQAYIRALQTPSQSVLNRVCHTMACLDTHLPSRHGRFELLHYLREVVISKDYHRYGNLMGRESISHLA